MSEKRRSSAFMIEEVSISSVPPSSAAIYHSPAQVHALLVALTDAELRRLETRSHYLARDQRILAADLRQEAYVRLLNGQRKCRVGVDIVDVIIGIMRSMVSAEREAEAEGNRPVLVGAFGDGGIDAISLAPSPEQVGHDALHYRRTLAAISAELGDDPKLLAMLDAVLDGVKGQALQDKLGLTKTGLASLHKKLRRRLERAAQNRSLP